MLVELAIKYYGIQCTCITSNYQFQYWPSLLHNVIYESNYRSDYDIIQQGSDQMIQRWSVIQIPLIMLIYLILLCYIWLLHNQEWYWIENKITENQWKIAENICTPFKKVNFWPDLTCFATVGENIQKKILVAETR
jgi:hypothetical protein